MQSIKHQSILTQSSFSKHNPVPQHRSGQPSKGDGYISDYYLNQQQKQRRFEGQASGPEEPEVGEQPVNGATSQNKLSNKKFFKSKIDFMAPIKSLRGNGRDDPNNNLSDDTYYEPA
jgi:hypothetical protein